LSAAAFMCGLLLHVASWHGDPGYRGDNPGAGVECQRGAAVVAVGTYANSVGRQSVYAVGGPTVEVGPIRLGAVVGVINGYRAGREFQPVAAGVASVGLARNVGLRLLVIPRVSGVSPATVHAAIAVGF
jgi:hypothetical protein